MAIQIEQAITVGKYLFMQRLMGRKKFPLVLMLEPLFRCNLACSGCGKIQHPKEILKQNLSPEDCFKAVEECGAPVVSIPGGEPLLHPQIDQIVELCHHLFGYSRQTKHHQRSRSCFDHLYRALWLQASNTRKRNHWQSC